MKTFSIRLDDEIFNKFELARGEKSRNNYIQEIIIKYLNEPEVNHGEQKVNQNEQKDEPGMNQNEQKDEPEVNQLLKDEVEFLRGENIDLRKLLNQEQSLHLQTQRQLMPTQEEITKKAWWKFWKK
jgi:predicted DNA-binding protein